VSTPVWSPGVLYNPGAIVRRVSNPPVVAVPVTNGGFESGDVSWTKGTGWTIVQSAPVFSGTWAANFSFTGNSRLVSTAPVAVAVGQTIVAALQVQQGSSSAGQAGARIQLDWLDAASSLISTSEGSDVNSGSNGAWGQSNITAVAPPGAAFVRPAARAFRNSGSAFLRVDAFTWNYAFAPPIDGLTFQATQANAGFSAGVEPIWPTTVSGTVVDNEVTWTGINSSTVTWEAVPILVSGAVEPTFPALVGEGVADNTIIWTAVSRRITDERCPNTKTVAIAASKIFCADDDIIAFSATVNPLDWSSLDDAGYIPFGLQTYGANPVTALGLYRSNLVAFNSTGFQMWQVDQDPANMALLDAVPIDCVEPRTVLPVQNDLVFLNAVGVRNVGIAGASTNLQAGTFGEAIDPLVTAAIKAATFVPFSTFVPAYGQYWLFFGPEAFVLTMQDRNTQSWSRYLFPEEIVDTALLNNVLYLRTAAHRIWRVDAGVVIDDAVDVPADLTVSLLLHGDASFVDSSSYAHPATVAGGAAISAVTPQFGAGSMLFDAIADEVSYATNAAFNLSTDWTIECWVRPTVAAISGGTDVFRLMDGSTAHLILRYELGGVVSVLILDQLTGLETLTGTVVASVNEWSAIAVTYVASTRVVRLYVNGTLDASLTMNVGYANTPIPTVFLSGGSSRLQAGIDELRITNGTARYTGGSYTLATAAFPNPVAGQSGTPFPGVLQWPHLDFGALGLEKQFIGVDLVAAAPLGVAVSIGYDQRNLAARTADFTIPADTLPGMPVPIPVAGPSFDMRLTFASEQRWEWIASNLYVQDLRRP